MGRQTLHWIPEFPSQVVAMTDADKFDNMLHLQVNPTPAAEFLLTLLPSMDVESILKKIFDQGSALGPGLPALDGVFGESPGLFDGSGSGIDAELALQLERAGKGDEGNGDMPPPLANISPVANVDKVDHDADQTNAANQGQGDTDAKDAADMQAPVNEAGATLATEADKGDGPVDDEGDKGAKDKNDLQAPSGGDGATLVTEAHQGNHPADQEGDTDAMVKDGSQSVADQTQGNTADDKTVLAANSEEQVDRVQGKY